jgi:hypothetical protein
MLPSILYAFSLSSLSIFLVQFVSNLSKMRKFCRHRYAIKSLGNFQRDMPFLKSKMHHLLLKIPRAFSTAIQEFD